MKAILSASVIALALTLAPEVASAQSTPETRPHASGGTIDVKDGRYLPRTYQPGKRDLGKDTRPESRSFFQKLRDNPKGIIAAIPATFREVVSSPATRQNATRAARFGGLGVVSGKALPFIVAVGTGYGVYELGRYGYEWWVAEE